MFNLLEKFMFASITGKISRPIEVNFQFTCTVLKENQQQFG